MRAVTHFTKSFIAHNTASQLPLYYYYYYDLIHYKRKHEQIQIRHYMYNAQTQAQTPEIVQ